MLFGASANFYLTGRQLQSLPSRGDGIDVESEVAMRFEGCLLVRKIGLMLRQPQLAIAAGQVLFHRFFCVTSFSRYDLRRAAKACAWLASKLEECPRNIRDFVMLYHHMHRLHETSPIRVPIINPNLNEIAKIKEDLLIAEMDVLRALGFLCHMDLPYKFITAYLWELEASWEFKQVAWNLANDSFLTTLCIRFKNHVVACGVVYAAARKLKVPLPEKWFEVFDVRWDEIKVVCVVLAQLYRDVQGKNLTKIVP